MPFTHSDARLSRTLPNISLESWGASTARTKISAPTAAAAKAAIETAQAAIRDAQLDLEFSQVTASLTGRIGAHLVSVGNLVSCNRERSGGST